MERASETRGKATNRYESDSSLSWWALEGALLNYRDYSRREQVNLKNLGEETINDIIKHIHNRLAKDIEKFYFENLVGMRVKLKGEIGTKEWRDIVRQYQKDYKDLHGQNSVLDLAEFLEWLIRIGRDRKVSEVMKELQIQSG